MLLKPPIPASLHHPPQGVVTVSSFLPLLPWEPSAWAPALTRFSSCMGEDPQRADSHHSPTSLVRNPEQEPFYPATPVPLVDLSLIPITL